MQAGRPVEAKEALEAAIEAFQTTDDRRGAAEAIGTLAIVLGLLGDPRAWELPADAMALLEPLPPGPDHVAALTELARAEALQGRNEAGIDYAERALSLATQLGLPKPARTLGYRGWARCQLGDRGGLDDFREAIPLASQAGQGREVAILHSNLAIVLWPIEGPSAALEVMRAGIAFTEARGLTSMTHGLTANLLDALDQTGEHEQALDLASELATASEASGNLADLISARAVQARILTLRGRASQIANTLDSLETTSREARNIDLLIVGGEAAASTRVALAQPDHAAALLAEIAATPGSRENGNYSALLPALVRSALTTNHYQLAHQLTIGVQPHWPYHEHALATATAALSEANDNLDAAADGYADAAQGVANLRCRARAGVRPPRPGPLPRRARPADRGRPAP